MDQDIVTLVENRVFDEIRVGDTASVHRTIRADDITLFSAAPGLAVVLNPEAASVTPWVIVAGWVKHFGKIKSM
jgi:hypothetical protein